ncbi:MAG: HD domain-containing protein [Clostridiales bacterium]|nr:HD domain-containing protein [Clostridiales bacterium]
MDMEIIRERMKAILNENRYQHVLGVEEVCKDLAVIHGYDMEKAGIAGLLHDCAKNLTDEELLQKCKEYHLPVTEAEEKSIYLLHAKVGAAIAKDQFGVHDDDILKAITFHTTGRPAMSLLEKIVFTADYIEPNRKPLPRIKEIRIAAYDNLDLAVFLILKNTLDYLKSTSANIDKKTIETYEYYRKVDLNLAHEDPCFY